MILPYIKNIEKSSNSIIKVAQQSPPCIILLGEVNFFRANQPYLD